MSRVLKTTYPPSYTLRFSIIVISSNEELPVTNMASTDCLRIFLSRLSFYRIHKVENPTVSALLKNAIV